MASTRHFISPEALEKVIADHKLWLYGKGGKRGELRNHDLSGYNFSNCDLNRFDFNGCRLCCTNFTGASLREADFSHADLTLAKMHGSIIDRAICVDTVWQDVDLDSVISMWKCIGDGRYIKSIQISDDYPITYTHNYLQIGCQKKLIKDWFNLDTKYIAEMYGKTSATYWAMWKETLRTLIKKSPAMPTIKAKV